MPSGKPSGNLLENLLFMEALLHTLPMTTTKGHSASRQADDPAGLALDTIKDRIIQEITAVGRRLEGMDSNISALTAETKSARMDIVGFPNRVMKLEHRILVAEDHLNTLPERNQKRLFLQSKVIDLEDRSCRDNVCFFGLPERVEESEIKGFLKTTLPALAGLTFELLLEFQRVHRMEHPPYASIVAGRIITPSPHHHLLSAPPAG
ncbi:hypothetical protein NDU88_005495 [Pleurodeles waltl]|uniref:Uncharacterized protein n=1 Tax=Pleurodeles waltl TaxID=8319 RepID=A0AAV7TUH5_PLEWA|nr:hypothetical protein NDU88_005495 [Pleurodeles waltl]